MPIECVTLRLGPLENNSYVLRCTATGDLAVVDPGFEPEALVAEARRLGGTVRWVLATHAHFDHVAGAREVQQALGGTFRLHPADRPLLAALGQQAAMFGFPHAEPPDEVVDLRDGEDVALGAERLRVIHTPGHSPGHVSFHHGGDLWSGDVLFAGSVGRTDLPGGSFDQLERAIRTRLFPLGDAVRVHTGHGPATTLGHERRTNPFVGEGAGRR